MAEMALERGLLIHSSCIWRWVQISCSQPNAMQRQPSVSFVKRCSTLPNPQPRVINVDKNRAHPAAEEGLKVEGTLRRRCRLRQCKYLNNVVEQDHRVSKKRVWLARGYQSSSTAWRTLQGIEAVT